MILTETAQQSQDPGLPEIDSIRTEYHPNSGRASKINKFEDYRMQDAGAGPPPIHERPWQPFRSRTDFEFAEIALEAALTKAQIDKLIKIYTRCLSGHDSFSLTSERDLRDIWGIASTLHTPVVSETV